MVPRCEWQNDLAHMEQLAMAARSRPALTCLLSHYGLTEVQLPGRACARCHQENEPPYYWLRRAKLRG